MGRWQEQVLYFALVGRVDTVAEDEFRNTLHISDEEIKDQNLYHEYTQSETLPSVPETCREFGEKRPMSLTVYIVIEILILDFFVADVKGVAKLILSYCVHTSRPGKIKNLFLPSSIPHKDAPELTLLDRPLKRLPHGNEQDRIAEDRIFSVVLRTFQKTYPPASTFPNF